MKREKRQISAPVRRVILAISIVSLLGGMVGVGYYLWENWRARSINQVVEAMYRQAEREAYDPQVGTGELERLLAGYMPGGEPGATKAPRKSEPAKTDGPTSSPQADGNGGESVVAAQTSFPDMTPLFHDLSLRNPDIVGWVTSGGDVDYPVLWRDNEYYMNHNFFGEESPAGAVFLDEENSFYMDDEVLLLYGHHMNNGDMFGKLDAFRKISYLKENPVVTLQTAWEEVPRKYVIFSVFDASMAEADFSFFDVRKFDFESEQDRSDFVLALIARSAYPIDIDVHPDDQLLGMVTCSYTLNDGRLIIWARKLRDSETETVIKGIFMGM